MLAVDRARGSAFPPVAMQGGGDGSLRRGRGEFHDSRSGGCSAGNPPAEEVGPTVVFDGRIPCFLVRQLRDAASH